MLPKAILESYMITVRLEGDISDDERRRKLFAGKILIRSPSAVTLEFCSFTRRLLEDALAPYDPQTAQHQMPVEQFAAIMAKLKPSFIHHPESKRFLRAILEEAGCDPRETYFDVPRLRSSTSHDYLTTGIAYAFHPHRDTWYSAPMCQINWWIPVYEIEAGNAMAFHPHYWDTPVPNSSADYDYQRWNATSRFNAAQHIGSDSRSQPKPLIPLESEPDLRLLPPTGGAILFSAAQLHSSVHNLTDKTRYSVDFRVINITDARALRGAPNQDSCCTGTAMPDFIRMSDLDRVPQDVIDTYMKGHPQLAHTHAPGPTAPFREAPQIAV